MESRTQCSDLAKGHLIPVRGIKGEGLSFYSLGQVWPAVVHQGHVASACLTRLAFGGHLLAWAAVVRSPHVRASKYGWKLQGQGSGGVLVNCAWVLFCRP